MGKKNQNRAGNRLLRLGVVWGVLLALLFFTFLLSIAIGSARYSIPQVWNALWHENAGKVRITVLYLRLPRAVLAVLVGASLSAAGALLQAVMRNPLADPGTIGVSAGAGAAAITVLLLFPGVKCS